MIIPLFQTAIALLSALLCAILAASALSGRTLLTDPVRAPRGIRWVWGALLALGAAGLLLSIRVPFFCFFAAGLLTLLIAGAWLAALLQGRSGRPARVLGGLLLGVIAAGALQPLGLKVLALPKAEALPRDPARSAQVLKAYGPGMWFEGIAVAADGTLYLSGNTGENYATGDKRQVQAEVIARGPDGAERVFFKLPQGSTAGVPAFGPDGALYLTGTGANLGLWRIDPSGAGRLLAELPEGAWPNGLTFGPDGSAYVADSALGLIWRIDPRSGGATKAFEGDLLRARKYIALPPGANGLHFFGRDLFVTVSDAGTLLKFHLDPQGRLGSPVVVASGVPADDFAIDSRGAIYLTTHVYDTLVRVDPDGRRVVVADATNGIAGATDCAFGTRPGDQDTLYVVTDGGALASGDAAARGTLVAVNTR